jgi:hypothetical protein
MFRVGDIVRHRETRIVGVVVFIDERTNSLDKDNCQPFIDWGDGNIVVESTIRLMPAEWLIIQRSRMG